MLRVDRCRDMDKLIKLLSPIWIIVRMPELDCFLRYRIDYGTLSELPCYMEFYIRENPTYGTPLQLAVVLFTEPSEDLYQR